MRRLFAILAISTCVCAVPQISDALYRTNKAGDVDLGGRLRSTNLFRHSDIDKWAFIMQRNELKLRFEWKWLQRGKAFGRYQVPWLERSDLFVVYRGIYDSVYDTTPGQVSEEDADSLNAGNQPGIEDLQGDPIPRRLLDLESIDDKTRDEIKFNNRIREAYVDLYFKNIPFTLRMGKQQIVWGESDGFRMLDRANTLDLSWHFFQELPPPGFGFDELRNPFWMIKGLWDFKQIGPLSQPFLEFYWNPGDWIPGEVSFMPRPWGVRLLDPLENAAGTGALQSAAICNVGKAGCNGGLMNGTELFEQGDWNRNPLDNSQFGVRFHFITPQGVEMTLNYLYQRFSPDGSPVALVRGLPVNGTQFLQDTQLAPGNQPGEIANSEFCRGLAQRPGPFSRPWAADQICFEYFAPYVHTVGFSLNWFEGDWTQTVWRVETIMDFDLPFYDGDKRTAGFDLGPGAPLSLPGITNRNMWKGMLAFDRPTWIKWLNKQTTFFVTGQFFWHYIINHERRRCAIDDHARFLFDANGEILRDPETGEPQRDPEFVGYTSSSQEACGAAVGNAFVLPGEQTGLVGPLDLLKLNRPLTPEGFPRGRDTIHQWELLTTLAVLGFYKGGSLVPALIYILDPVNAYSQEIAFGVDWFITPDVAINVATRLIWAGLPWDAYDGHQKLTDPDDGLIFDPWFVAGGSRGRSESGVMFTWQF